MVLCLNERPKQSDRKNRLQSSGCQTKKTKRLRVFLKQATALPKKGEEPYGTIVKTSLTSSSGSKSNHIRMSRPTRKTSSPVYGEEHIFQISRSKWSNSGTQLRLSVFDCDRQGRHDAVGHALLPLDKISTEEEREHCLPLTPMSMPVKNLGQVLVGLLYIANQSRLAVHVVRARRLRIDAEAHKQRHLTRPIGSSREPPLDTLCKVTLTCGGQKVKTCRSKPCTGPEPFFDFRATFVVPPQYLRDAGAVVSVVRARSTLPGRGGPVLGRAGPLGPYVETSDGRATHWGRMVRESKSIVQWRNLYL